MVIAPYVGIGVVTTPALDLPTLPASLALVDDDRDFGEFLAQFLRRLDVLVTVFRDSNDLIASANPYGYGFYIVDLMLPGVDGAELIRVLRRRTQAGIVVVSGKLAPEVFREVVAAGADMYLAKPVRFEQVAAAIGAVQRRVESAGASAQSTWQLDASAQELIAPDGARIALSDADLVVMRCLVEAAGEPVTRAALRAQLGQKEAEGDSADEAGDGLNAVIYRLRRRIERATPLLVPLQSKSRVGYLFRAPLQTINR